MKARAIETGCFVIAAAQTGLHKTGRETFGHGLVIDPWGEILLDMGEDVGSATLDLDLSHVAASRQRIPSLMHDRDVCVQKVQAG